MLTRSSSDKNILDLDKTLNMINLSFREEKDNNLDFNIIPK